MYCIYCFIVAKILFSKRNFIFKITAQNLVSSILEITFIFVVFFVNESFTTRNFTFFQYIFSGFSFLYFLMKFWKEKIVSFIPKIPKNILKFNLFKYFDIWKNFVFWQNFNFIDQNFNFWQKFQLMTTISIFDQNLNVWPKFKCLTKIFKISMLTIICNFD